MNIACEAIRAALRSGDELANVPRQVVDVPSGQLLLMPASNSRYSGVKVASVAPANPAAGLARIQGVYVLMDGATLSPVWQCDAAMLTLLRTTAVSMVALEMLDARCDHVVVFCTGPQAAAHVRALIELFRPSQIHVVGRTLQTAQAFVSSNFANSPTVVVAAESARVSAADTVVCCTSSHVPLFEGSLVTASPVVVAIGSHTRIARELPGDLVARSSIVLESMLTLPDAGDVVLAMAEFTSCTVTTTLGDLVRGTASLPSHAPRVFKSVGQAWQDLAVAEALYDQHLQGGAGP